MILLPWTLLQYFSPDWAAAVKWSNGENLVIIMGYIQLGKACDSTPRPTWRDVPRGPEVNRTWLLLNWKRERGCPVIARNKRWRRRWTVHLLRRLMKIRVLRLTLGKRVNCFPSFPTSSLFGTWGDANQRDGPFISPRAERKNEGKMRQKRTE